MSRIIAFIHLTLNGVMQSPDRPDENRRGGFEYPLALGTGRRLFTDGGPSAKLRLVDSKTTTKGVVIVTDQSERTSGRAA